MTIRVLAPGALTTVQDGGRDGYRHLGVGGTGALDAYSHAVANVLVGNRRDAAALEITLAGPRLRFERAARIALSGADIDAYCDGRAIPAWRPVSIQAGATLAFGACRRGARAYLAVAGGIDVPTVLGSASTDLRGGFGGVEGRALVAGDALQVVSDGATAVDALRVARWWIDPSPDLAFDTPAIVRVLPGSDTVAPAGVLFDEQWRVAAASDRQGLRLEGEMLRPANPGERISEPVAPGTLQLPPDGRPIVLLADAQTHGGYPRIGHVIRADRPRLAQLRPGDRLRFQPCDRAQALDAWRDRCHRLARIEVAISTRLQTA
jgi:antagonist of KipI